MGRFDCALQASGRLRIGVVSRAVRQRHVRLTACLFLIGSEVIAPVQAHHSFPAIYFLDQKIDIEGTVVQFLFRNPHSFIHVLAPDKDGIMQTWAVEWGPGILLASDNINSDTLQPGDKVKITGSPGRNAAEHRIRISTIERTSDHWKWKGAFDCS
jgi:Family of unknown function (DUF6152)